MDYKIINNRVQTRALEFHIVDHCNLRCDHCCSFSPLLKKWTVDLKQFEEDLINVKRVVEPQFLKIVGGEPLLHPELEELLVIAKRVNVSPNVSLTTNGFLLEKLSQKSWDLITMLTVSLYPEPALPKEILKYAATQAKKRNIKVSWKTQDKFTCLDRVERATYEDAKYTFQGCWIRHRCNSIKNGRFYCCTRPQYIQKFAQNGEEFLNDGILLADSNDAKLSIELKNHLEGSEPLNSCFICHGGHAPLDTHSQLTGKEISRKRERLRIIASPVQKNI